MAADSIELDDMGVAAKLGLKGAGAAEWLSARQLSVPRETYEATRLGAGGWLVKIGGAEFFAAPEDSTVIDDWLSQGSLPTGVYRAPREEVALVLKGDRPKLLAVFAQTCAIEVAKAPAHRIFYSRVAGVSCGILPETTAAASSFRLWIDATYADYMWEMLSGIVAELGGRADRSPRHLRPASLAAR